MEKEQTPSAAPRERLWLRPQVLLSALICLICLGFFLATLRRPRVPLTQIEIQPEIETSPETFEVLVVRSGEAQTVSQSAALALDGGERLRGVLVALATTSVWPEGLEVPSVLMLESERVAVLNFSPKPSVAVSAEAEWDVLRSIRGTLERQGIDEVRILVEGQEASTFLGHVRP